MNRERIVSGIIFIGIGLLLLLANLGYFSWWILGSLWEFWPLILIVIGINTIFKKSTIVAVISWVLFFAVLVGYSFYFDGRISNNITRNHMNEIEVNKMEETQTGELKLNLGGLRLMIGGTEEPLLIDTNYAPDYISPNISYRNGNKNAVININSINNTRVINFNPSGELFDFNLNKDVVWDIDASVGAVSGDIDLRELQIKDFKLNVGAGSLDLYFGDAYPETNVRIDGGASNIKINIAEEAGVRMKIDGLVSKSNLANLGWVNRGDYYYSPNYDEASSKISFDVKIGVGKVDVVVN
ncbi:LiaI-LiaF-like domain-containing protein [Alkaliphilus transvaalensis]|uniref:LiaI-LiaF-like domain-containing protein n=1 Tax=Alkaliphilus transvaalensis TaxID=114628 RepID=UPI00047B689E|nr:DUF5668 domain-containing protein [Alkaliphilus transvaalensis]